MNLWKLPNPFKKARKDWHTNIDPTSKRFLTPSQLSLDPTGEDSEIEDYEVTSTAIKAFTWNPETHSLFVTFVGGDKEYEYPNVPEEYVKALESASSKGRYLNNVIKPNFSLRR